MCVCVHACVCVCVCVCVLLVYNFTKDYQQILHQIGNKQLGQTVPMLV